MTSLSNPLPDFDNPPVIEVFLSLQFAPLSALDAARIGLFWSSIREEFPNAETKPILPTHTETFGVISSAKPQIEIVQEPITPRFWMIGVNQSELIQVQSDRLVFNWRKSRDDEPYPRYGTVLGRFMEHYSRFKRFLEAEEIGQIVPNQCEVTYINIIEPNDAWERWSQISEILTCWENQFSDDFLSALEDVRVHIRKRIIDEDDKSVGRLHIEAEPRVLRKDQTPVIQLQLIARGAPIGDGMDGVKAFFDLGHENIVRGFASVTTKKMHEIWGRTNHD